MIQYFIFFINYKLDKLFDNCYNYLFFKPICLIKPVSLQLCFVFFFLILQYLNNSETKNKYHCFEHRVFTVRYNSRQSDTRH